MKINVREIGKKNVSTNLKELKTMGKKERKELYNELIKSWDFNTFLSLKSEFERYVERNKISKIMFKVGNLSFIKPKMVIIGKELSRVKMIMEMRESMKIGESPYTTEPIIFDSRKVSKEILNTYWDWEEVYEQASKIARMNGLEEGVLYLTKNLKEMGVDRFSINFKNNFSFYLDPQLFLSSNKKEKKESKKVKIGVENKKPSLTDIEKIKKLIKEGERRTAAKKITLLFENERVDNKIKLKLMKISIKNNFKELSLYLSKKINIKDNISLRKEAFRANLVFSDEKEILFSMLRVGTNYIKVEEKKKNPKIRFEEIRKIYERLGEEDKEIFLSKLLLYARDEKGNERMRNNAIEIIGKLRLREHKELIKEMIMRTKKKSTLRKAGIALSELCN